MRPKCYKSGPVPMNATAKSLLALSLVAAGGVLLWRVVAVPGEGAPAAPVRDAGPVPVTVRSLALEPRPRTLEVFGSLEARRSVRLALEVGGRLGEVSRAWSPGAEVAAGEALLSLDTVDLDLRVRTAEAARAEARAAVVQAEVALRRAGTRGETARERVDLARREDERTRELAAQGHASDRDLDRSRSALLDAEEILETTALDLDASEAALDAARARADSAAANLDTAVEERNKARLVAPFAGRLVGPAPAPGSLVGPGEVLGTLVDPRSLVLAARVPAPELLDLVPGLPARVSFPRSPELGDRAEIPGVLAAIDATVDPSTRRGRVDVELRLEGRGADLRPAPLRLAEGSYARARIDLGEAPGLWIARAEIRWEADGPVAWVLGEGPEGDRAERRTLVFEREDGEGFVVRSGLAPGDRLIVRPLERLSPDAPVRALPDAGGEAPVRER